ncbi:hypothetical protein TNCV_1955771 [Trichonephila clavipes]|nr:hypothetical protein TNCV_1955771 [Trichonephila clavipes]
MTRKSPEGSGTSPPNFYITPKRTLSAFTDLMCISPTTQRFSSGIRTLTPNSTEIIEASSLQSWPRDYYGNMSEGVNINIPHCSATRGLLAMDLVILNHSQVQRMKPELASPLLTTTPHHINERTFELPIDISLSYTVGL